MKIAGVIICLIVVPLLRAPDPPLFRVECLRTSHTEWGTLQRGKGTRPKP